MKRPEPLPSEPRRLDIDLLRAIAVLAVIAYHLRLPSVTGGFVGVDIFFVISGYLITRQIWSRIDDGSFSFIEFLSRRARRLVPALAVTLLGTALAAPFLLAPDTFGHLQKELIASAGYFSNISFWLESGYFDAAAITKPLLHTWSLSVEEQFYLLWPVGLLLIAAHRRAAWLAVLGLVSFGFCEWMIAEGGSAAFFLFPFRIFEFVIGALIPGIPVPRERRIRLACDLMAMIALLAPIFALTQRSHFPGVSVLPSCLATAWLIASRPAWLNRPHAGARLGQWIGKVSYSAYLVHWPLIVFWMLTYDEELGAVEAAGLFAATMLLAGLLWRYIERPCLESKLPVQRFLPGIPVTLALVYGLTALGPPVYSALHADRADLDALVTAVGSRKEWVSRLRSQRSTPRPDAPRVAIVGDSHAADVGLALRLAAGNALDIRIVTTVCHPLAAPLTEAQIRDLYSSPRDSQSSVDRCLKAHSRLLGRILAEQADLIVFSEHWREEALPYLVDSLRAVRQASGVPVLVLGLNQGFRDRPGRLLKRVTRTGQIRRMAWDRRADKPELNLALQQSAATAGALFIAKTELVCPAQGLCDYVLDGRLTYSDNTHWSEAGLDVFGVRLYTRLRASGLLVRGS